MHKTLIVLFHGMNTQYGAALRHVLGHIIRGDETKEMNYEIGVNPNLTFSMVKSENHDHRAINAILIQSGAASRLNYITINVTGDYVDPMKLGLLMNMPADVLRLYQAFLMDCVEEYDKGNINIEEEIKKRAKAIEMLDLSLDDLLDLMKERGGGREVLTEKEIERLDFLESEL
jgi:hypothetical protein